MVEQEDESTYLEIKVKNGTPIILGSLYRSPNTDSSCLKEHIIETVNKIKSEKGGKEMILSMDPNLDLLKSIQHKQTAEFLESNLDLNLIPTIMRPTIITNTSTTLIDNTFFSDKLQ